MNRKSKMFLLILFLICANSLYAQKPNIVWIMAEDISTELSCYGHPGVKTPNLDQLSKEGTLYKNAFTTAPSCTPSRNAMLTGVYQTRTDTQDQRRRGIMLPEHIKPFTELLRDAGYYTAVGCGFSPKTDHNFVSELYGNNDKTEQGTYLFDGKDWKHRKQGQPFFAQITLNITHRQKGTIWQNVREQSKHPVDTANISLPPYFPQHPVILEDWAMYLDAIEKMDLQVGEILQRLEQEGIADNTIVIFIGDNGSCHLRGKCWLYDAGINVPLIIRLPGKKGGVINNNLISMIDIAATILKIAEAERPQYLDGHSIIGPDANKREHIFAARDLIDEVMDHIRCVRTKQFKYIRNYTPENGYKECKYVQEHRPMLSVIKELNKANKLTPAQQLILADTKPDEELYDIKADPYELNNLAEIPEYKDTLIMLRSLLDDWIADTGDKGLARQ